jgi:hypothetical protein
MSPNDKAKDGPPHWIKVFGAVALAFVVIVAAVHLAGGGMGHFGHTGASPVEHGSYAPRS